MSQMVFFEDQFKGSSLDKSWSWVREQSNDWLIKDGGLFICTRPGSLMIDSNDARNILIRPMLECTNIMQVLVECDPQEPFEQAGLLWYYDDDHYIKLVKEMVEGKQMAVFVREENAKADVLGKIPLVTDDPIELCISVSQDTITGQYRVKEADEWTTIAQGYPFKQSGFHAGLFTHGGMLNVDRWAIFSNFRMYSSKAMS